MQEELKHKDEVIQALLNVIEAQAMLMLAIAAQLNRTAGRS